MYKLDLDKKELEIKLPTSIGTWKKQENSRKTSTSASLTMLKPLTVWIPTNCGKFLKRWEYWTIVTCFLRNLYVEQEATVRMTLTMDWFQIKEGVCQGCILSACLFNLYTECIMWMPGWMKLESRLLGEISITSDMQMTLP